MRAERESGPEEGPAARRIARFLHAYRGLPFCPECLQRECDVPGWQALSVIERLGRHSDFARSDWWCSLCLQRRLVIEARDEQGLIERLTGSH